MKKHVSISALLIGVCCVILLLCSCGRNKQNKKSVSPETLRLMQKTQSELTACVERCRSAAQESKDKEILLALANSQQVLADRHETIISILLKKNKLERTSTVSYSIEMDPRTLVLPPVKEYRELLAKADPERTLREVLIALEITNKVLESDAHVLSLIDPDSEYAPDVDFFFCPVCGLLSMQEIKESCPVCHSDKDRCIKLKDGEIPPPDEESFVVTPN